MDIKKILLDDLIEIIDSYLEYFNNFENSEWNKQKVYRKFKQLTDRYDYVGLGMYADKKIIGFCLGSLSQFDDGLVGLLNELFISKEKQSQGYGSKLLKAFEDEMRIKGAFRIQLESANDDSHNNFYNKMHNYTNANNNVLKAKSIIN